MCSRRQRCHVATKTPCSAVQLSSCRPLLQTFTAVTGPCCPGHCLLLYCFGAALLYCYRTCLQCYCTGDSLLYCAFECFKRTSVPHNKVSFAYAHLSLLRWVNWKACWSAGMHTSEKCWTINGAGFLLCLCSFRHVHKSVDSCACLLLNASSSLLFEVAWSLRQLASCSKPRHATRTST